MPICSTTKIVVGTTTLLNFDDHMEEEVSISYSQVSQVAPLIRSTWSFNEGRQNSVVNIGWSRYYYFDPDTPTTDTDSLDAARIFQAFHVVPGGVWPDATGNIAEEYPTQCVSIPDGTNSATLSFNYGYGTPDHTVVYASSVIESADATITHPDRVLVRYQMICTGATITGDLAP